MLTRTSNFHPALILCIGAAILAVVTLLGLGFAPYLSARVPAGTSSRFAITGPATVTPGASATITWTVSAENQRRYPAEKIELCRARRCTTLASQTPNDGSETVQIPANWPTEGESSLKLTARRSLYGLLLWQISTTRQVSVVKADDTSTSSNVSPRPRSSPEAASPAASPTPSATPRDEYTCQRPCTGIAPDPAFSLNCASYTTQAQCAEANTNVFPYHCAWLPRNFVCTAP